MSGAPRVAVLGAGITGSCLALQLARRGAEVTVVDRETRPMEGTSRWNEGKIHLGYLYGADPTLGTARHVIPGGLAFARIMSDLLDTDLASHSTSTDDIYLVHQDSIVGMDALRSQFEAVSQLVRSHQHASDYLVDVSRACASELGPAELADLGSGKIVGGFRVPERSVDTRWLADALAAAVTAHPRITLRPATVVTRVDSAPLGEPIRVVGLPDLDESFDSVVNALWGGRLEIDVTAGLLPDYTWSHRYRRCLFIRTRVPVDVPSALVAIGPFGDVKNYNQRDFYLSWYPVGLVAQGSEVSAPTPEPLTEDGRTDFIKRVRSGLEATMPRIGEVFDAAEEVTVSGGYVFARGQGSIGDPASALHRRDRYGVERRGNYYSVDTGKYSTAPSAALALADEIMGVA